MERQDDPTLSGSLRLWRRIPPWADRVKVDPHSGELRPSSMNFRDRNNELSVYLATEARVDEVVRGHEGFGLVEFTVDEARQLLPGIIVCRDPEPLPPMRSIAARSPRLHPNAWHGCARAGGLSGPANHRRLRRPPPKRRLPNTRTPGPHGPRRGLA